MDARSRDAINNPIRLEMYLPILVNAQRKKFAGVRPAIGKALEAIERLRNSIEHMARLRSGIMLGYVFVDLFEVPRGVSRKEDLTGHYFSDFSRSRRTASAAEMTSPASI